MRLRVRSSPGLPLNFSDVSIYSLLMMPARIRSLFELWLLVFVLPSFFLPLSLSLCGNEFLFFFWFFQLSTHVCVCDASTSQAAFTTEQWDNISVGMELAPSYIC